MRHYKDQHKDPSEVEITAAFKKLIMKAPVVGFITGHTERGIDDKSESGYYSFAADRTGRNALINQGFDIQDRTLDRPIPIDIDMIVIADSKSHFSELELSNYKKFIDRGGSALILGEPRRQEFMNPLIDMFGLKFKDGMVVTNSDIHSKDVIFADFDGNSDIGGIFKYSQDKGYSFAMPTVAAIEQFDTHTNFDVKILAKSPAAGSWIEKKDVNFITTFPELNTNDGEVEESNVISYYVTRKIGDKTQKIVVLGDADCLSTKELIANRAGIYNGNFSVMNNTFYVFTDGEFPVNINRIPSPDNRYTAEKEDIKWMYIVYSLIIPGIILFMGLFLLFKRKRQ